MRARPFARLVALGLALVGAIAISATGAGMDAGVGTGTGTGTGVGSDQGLVVTPTPLDFGAVSVGSSAGSSLSLANTNVALPVDINSLGMPSTTDCNAFTVTPTPGLPDKVPAMTTRTWPVTFRPTSASAYDCQWTLDDDDGNIDTIHLTGTGVVGHITVTPNPVDFGSQPVGGMASLPVTVTNDGSGAISVTTIKQTSGNPPFTISGLPILPVTLQPTQSTKFTATFAPTKGGPASGAVQIADNAPASAGTTVMLSGSGSGVVGGSTISLTPSPLDVGNVAVGGSGDATIDINSMGTVMVSGMSIAGSAAADFHFDDAPHGCTSGQSCTAAFTVTQGTPVPVQLACTPSVAGERFATITVTSNANGGANSATLECNGTAPSVTVSPGSISYGTVRVNTTAHAKLTIGNVGSRDLHVSALSLDGSNPTDFAPQACATGCTIGSGSSTQVDVTFTPPVRGVRTANLHVKSDDPKTPDDVVPLDGKGGLPVMVITQPSNAPPSIDFGQIPATMTSSNAPITVQNQGELTLNVMTAATSPSEFAASGTTTPFQLAPSASSTWNVTCTPDLPMLYTGSFTVTGDDPSTPSASVSLSCTGITSSLVALPSPVSFGDVRTDRTKTTTVTITNNGLAAVTIASAPATGTGFSDAVQGTLPRTLAHLDALKVDVTFAPNADMHDTGTLTLMDNNNQAALAVSLSGDGRVPKYMVAPATIDYGSMCVSQSASQDVLITNNGTAHINLVSTAITGPTGVFTISSGDVTTPVDLAPTASYTVSLVGTAASGAKAGDLIVTTDVDADETTMVSLAITGTQSGVVANPSAVSFTAEDIGVASTPAMVSIINCSAAPLMVSSAAVTGTDASAFQVSGSQPVTIPISGDQAWNVVFTAMHAGAHTAQLELTNDGATSPIVVTLSGNGTASGSGADAGPGGSGNAEQSTSYYACACRTGGGTAGGAPILLALALALRPRRRGGGGKDRRDGRVGRGARGVD